MSYRKWLLWLIGAPLLVLLALVGGIVFWLGTNTSLATTIDRAAAYLPAGHTLDVREVSGSVRRGGHVGHLRYQNPSLLIEAEDVAVDWQLGGLLQQEFRLGRLHIARLDIETTPSTTPATALGEIVLPLKLDLPFDIADLRWKGPPALQAQQLAGHYRFDGTQHQLDISSLHIASGQYTAQASLQARSPMRLQAKVQGTVDTSLPGSSKPLRVTATASAEGPLAGQEALLQIQAQLAPGNASVLQAALTAQIQPWADQPVHQADLRFQQLNLADLWPEAPQTLLSGTAQVQPGALGFTWLAQASVDNRQSGPWDKNRVPADHAEAKLQFQQGAWVIESLQAQLGKGEVQLAGHWNGAGSTDWTAQAQLRRINPAALHTRLDPALLNGQVSASSAGTVIRFDAALQPASNPALNPTLRGLRIRDVQAKGSWSSGTLSLSNLKVQTDDALLQGQLEVHVANRAGKGQLHLSLPGAQADVQGQLSAAQGAGDFAVQVKDADQASRWVARLPGAAASLQTLGLKGQGELKGRWTGGWATALNSKPGATPFHLQAQLAVPALEIRSPASTGTPIQLRQIQLDAAGSLAALELSLQGEAASGTQRVSLNSRASGGMATPNQWQARIVSLALQLQDSSRPGPWKLQLDQPVALKLATGAVTTLDVAAGSASISGPVAGNARIAWQPIAWARDGAHSRLRTTGTLQGVPMGWLETLAAGNGQLAQIGLQGNLVLDGDWDVQAGQSLQANANLSRRSGDLLLQTGEDAAKGAPSTISAGIRTARIGLRTDGNTLSASLRWDSERAGTAEADFSTQIRQTDEGWTWPADAPLNGSVRAELPRVGIWSVLAPPGWRMRGTLAANAKLSGTRLAPQWTGTLQADDLALRSVVEGIELRDGRLRATLDGQRLNIGEFSLRGAPSAANASTSAPTLDGGSLNATGSASWSSSAPAGFQLDMQAQAKTLRISARADRRLTVSGNLQAHLAQGKLALQGALKADQALFILPDENAPSLGNDVLVRSRSSTEMLASPATPVASNRTPEITLELDLGDDFHLVGRGLDTRLTGKLQLKAGPTLAGPRVTGELRTARGSYRAYGQQLDIDEGVLRFNGPYDNPALDVLAIRPNLSVRVGVQINGTALAPRIRLYSDSDLTDAEKLAWLVLGRSAANGGAEGAVLQQAALALLGGNGKGISGGLASALGLDELSFSGSASKTDGTTSAAAVTFGKRLSRNFYVAYEHSLAGTLGTLYIFYDLSKRFTLRAQTGEQSAIDLIFTLQYD